ncbi:hypothetical protein KQX54_018976 [Cotesia glomerata]|uniref:Uncharacterized protein n=1 Tax=Cotesia glomerata TaxID=32391 RepID=A0AAV7ITD1_COTGL|nr:hypothetical protein KQX54_018976 [Cotesia glomerata]
MDAKKNSRNAFNPTTKNEKRGRESAPILGQRTPGALQAPDLPPSGEVEKPLVVLVGNGWEYSNRFKKALSKTFRRQEARVIGCKELLFGFGMRKMSSFIHPFGVSPVSSILLKICVSIFIASSERFFITSLEILSVSGAD